MIKEYSKSEMVERWRLLRYWDPRRDDVLIECEGSAMGSLAEADFDAWWSRMVERAPVEWFGDEDVSDIATLVASDGGYSRLLFDGARSPRRLKCVRLEGWRRGGVIVDSGTHLAQLQLNELTRCGVGTPVAVRVSGSEYHLYPAGDGIAELAGVTGERYMVDDRLLAMRDEE